VAHNLRTENITVEVVDENNQPVEVTTEILSDTRIRITSERAVRSATVTVTGTIQKGQNPLTLIAEGTVRILSGGQKCEYYLPESGELSFLDISHHRPCSFSGCKVIMVSLPPDGPLLQVGRSEGIAQRAYNRELLTTDQALNTPLP